MDPARSGASSAVAVRHGDVAQLGEHQICILGVGGSSPLVSTGPGETEVPRVGNLELTSAETVARRTGNCLKTHCKRAENRGTEKARKEFFRGH